MRFDSDDIRHMNDALSLAGEALGEGEIPVGCVLISNGGEVLARTKNEVQRRGLVTAHAEMLALGSVDKHRLKGAKLYVTLEPCPMCAGAIALSGIKRVVFGAFDKKYGCCGSVYRLTEDPAFDRFCIADGGLLRDECEALLKRSFDEMRTRQD